jgi:MYXO-CTERM domain-containing protein
MPPRRPLLAARAHHAVALAAALIALTSPIDSRADIPPDPDSADAHCTPEEQCPRGVYCPYARRPGVKPSPDEVPVGAACRTEAQSKGLARRCRKGGNYSGEELFCPEGETGSWSSKASGKDKPSSSLCGVTAAGGPATTSPAALLLALAALLRLRRRPRASPGPRGDRIARTSPGVPSKAAP